MHPTDDDQPRPLSTEVHTIAVGGEPVSTILRFWGPADVARCRLCPRCAASVYEPEDGPRAHCMVVTQAWITDDEAPLYRFQPGDVQGERVE